MALQSNKIKKILAITAHPDDLELSFGGSVHIWFTQGCMIDNLIMCHHQPHKQYLSKTSAILGFAPHYYPLDDVNMRPVLTNDMIERIESFLLIFLSFVSTAIAGLGRNPINVMRGHV